MNQQRAPKSAPNARDEDATPATQTESAYAAIRTDIVHGTFDPMAKLRIDLLYERYGIGRSPLREALSRLTAEGLVVAEGQRGYWVAPMSRDEYGDIIRSRIMLENSLLTDSIAHGDLDWEGRVVATFHRLTQIEKTLYAEPEELAVAWARENWKFHKTLLSACTSQWLMRFVETLHTQSERYRHRGLGPGMKSYAALNAEHREIMEAALRRDVSDACAALTRHIQGTSDLVETALFGPHGLAGAAEGPDARDEA